MASKTLLNEIEKQRLDGVDATVVGLSEMELDLLEESLPKEINLTVTRICSDQPSVCVEPFVVNGVNVDISVLALLQLRRLARIEDALDKTMFVKFKK